MSVTLGVTTLVTHDVSELLHQQKERKSEYGKPDLEELNLPITRQHRNPFTKSNLMKSIVSYSGVLTPSRCVGFVAVMALAVLPALGAGSAKQAVQKDSDPSIKVYNQGVELMVAKKFPEAQAKFEQAVKENPRFAEAHNNLGYTLRKEGAANYQKSLEHYNTAIGLKPKLAEAYMYRGVLYIEMGRKSDAEADLAALQKLSPRLAKELAEVIKTGKEEDRFYGLASKISG
jgi:tetratricopeptide (TPR) repeat protein